MRACLASILEQEGVAYEIICVDNGSTDSDYAWVKAEEAVQFIALDKNYGFSKAVNEGIKRAKGEYVLLLNNDTVLQPHFLKKLEESIQKDERIFSVSSKMLRFDDSTKIDDAGDSYTLLGWTKKRGDGKPSSAYENTVDVFSACAGAALYRKTVFEEIGYFDESFFAYMEDVDIGYRARIHGYRNVYCPEAEVLHIGSATSGSRHNAFKVRLAARNNVYVPYKNMCLLQGVVNAPFLLVGYLIKYLYFVRKGFGKVYREGWLEGVKTCRQLEKVHFKKEHLRYYLRIEWELIKNTLHYFK